MYSNCPAYNGTIEPMYAFRYYHAYYVSIEIRFSYMISRAIIELSTILDNTPWLVNMPCGYSRPEGAVPCHH